MNQRSGTFVARVLAVTIALHVASPPRFVALAHAADQDTEEYREAVRVGLTEYEGQNYLEARAQFLRAHELFPNARTLRALGLTEFALHNYPSAIDRLQGALTSGIRPLDAELRRSVSEALATARHYVDRVVLRVEPRTASVSVDGLPAAQHDGALLLSLGDHVLELRMPGRQTVQRRLIVQGGATQLIEVELAPVLLPQAAPPTGQPLGGPATHATAVSPSHGESRWYQSPWFWTVLGVAVVGGIAGTAIVLATGAPNRRGAQMDGVVLTAPP